MVTKCWDFSHDFKTGHTITLTEHQCTQKSSFQVCLCGDLINSLIVREQYFVCKGVEFPTNFYHEESDKTQNCYVKLNTKLLPAWVMGLMIQFFIQT